MADRRKPTTRGFAQTSSLLQDRIRKAGETRGFAVTRLLTHWPEIVGDDIAAIARPVDVKYGRSGFGATLSLLTTGPHAPMLEMQKEQIRAKVNGVYGYNAISRLRITQTAPTGFAEGQAEFTYRPKPKPKPEPKPEVVAEAQSLAAPVGDDKLRFALEALGRNILSKTKR
ncbi:DUF721 domain-containing protein [Litorivita pollutaquae]|uniref:DUF721 domain-containing protein n=1 Tax=Litorivita pollutaquae TaxID=2200892 RepID=A0A2V4MQ62_9RHOB|nr:DciA family protein [Litorivita pollutaquae]OUS19333.1 RNA-binding protein [Rhodobacterales bacterium 59_46_T64]PYC47659.1 DUF721 domain-containing protein [Litorivita pollutaquae]